MSAIEEHDDGFGRLCMNRDRSGSAAILMCCLFFIGGGSNSNHHYRALRFHVMTSAAILFGALPKASGENGRSNF